ncbi:MAG: glycosyltransferase [Gemmatimonadaceae bacterium]
MRVALVHEWLITHGGSEEITAQLGALFPEADLFTLVADPVPSLRALIGERPVTTSFLQRLPGATRAHRLFLPLMPRAIESFDLTGYDLVISVSHAVAKGVRTAPGQVHLCICCSPMRYAWDLREQYLDESGLSRGVRGAAARWLLERLRRWDLATAGRPTRYAAISRFIADRIARAYGRSSGVLYPPVDTAYFTPAGAREAGLYVTASRMVPYKRLPLVVAAFAELPDRRLVVIGDGPEMPKVRAAAGANVTVLGHQPREALRGWLRRAQGFVFAAEEDFGIVPVEAMACGTPVVAYGRGGVRETVVGLAPGDESAGAPTGVFFEEQTVRAIAEGVRALEAAIGDGRIAASACRARAERFSVAAFQAGVRAELGALGIATV